MAQDYANLVVKNDNKITNLKLFSSSSEHCASENKLRKKNV